LDQYHHLLTGFETEYLDSIGDNYPRTPKKIGQDRMMKEGRFPAESPPDKHMHM
jgi:hypothetical protein